MRFVKSFKAETPNRLEEQMNNWIRESRAAVVDIKFLATPDGYHISYVIYSDIWPVSD